MQIQNRTINGVLLLDKPIGISSNQALQRVKKLFGAKKAGHTGTLDVLASGLLVICFGEATKCSQFLLDADKYYRVTAKLGQRTTTCDGEGTVVESKSTAHVTEALLGKILNQFHGEILQVPSMYSAIKYQGKPLYKLAIKGIEVERKARKIIIHELKLLAWSNDQITLDVYCSKGTYIRNLIDDIGQALQCGAYVTELRRLGVGYFDASQMLSIEQLQTLFNEGGFQNLVKILLPMEAMLISLPEIKLTFEQAKLLRFGRSIKIDNVDVKGLARLIEEPNNFLGVGEVLPDGVVVGKRLTAGNQ